jgi:hypothetical protein
MKVEVVVTGRLVASPDMQGDGIEDEIEKAFDRTITELFKLGDVIDPMISGSIATGVVELAFTVDKPDPQTAMTCGESAARAALHAAEVGTPTWETIDRRFQFEWEETTTRLARDGEPVPS